MRRHAFLLFIFALYVLGVGNTTVPTTAQEQPIRPGEREVARGMLDQIHSDLKNKYYDPKFHGVDIEARFKDAAEIIKNATSFNQALGAIAWALEPLNDSHTAFVPPPRAYRLSYGWRMQMIGDKCYVTAVKPGSNAEKKGLHRGDLVESVNGLVPKRDSFVKLMYLFNVLRPQLGLVLKVRRPDGTERELPIAAFVREKRHILNLTRGDFWDEIRQAQSDAWLSRHRWVTIRDDVMVWKMPSFMMDEKGADEMVGKARRGKVLILDLRSNPGGSVDTLDRMVGNFFDHEVKIADLTMRGKTKPQLAESRGAKAFAGKLIVLVDSRSSSAAEVFARTVQLEKRGTVLGDQSSGLVMESEFLSYTLGIDRVIQYAATITRADLIMADGKSLEHNGVTPDVLILPTAEDLAKGRDPVLAYAAKLAGVALTPAKAAELFPVEWPTD